MGIKRQVSKGQAVKGRWEISGIRTGQGHRTAIALQRTVQGNIEGGQAKGGDTGGVLKKGCTMQDCRKGRMRRQGFM